MRRQRTSKTRRAPSSWSLAPTTNSGQLAHRRRLASDRLTATGHAATYGDTFACYPDAGHNVTPFSVGVPTTTAMHSFTKEFGEYLALGGTAAGIAHASRDADLKMRAFLEANL